jgi:hypothetical protein
MRIAVIGMGNVGSVLGSRWAEGGDRRPLGKKQQLALHGLCRWTRWSM